MSRLDVVVWEVIGETFWLVALVVALVLGLVTQAKPTVSSFDQNTLPGIMQTLPESHLETWSPPV